MDGGASLYPPGQRPLWVGDKREEFPLFGKEGSGEIFRTICLLNYELLSNFLIFFGFLSKGITIYSTY
jgi:hypothetical protein